MTINEKIKIVVLSACAGYLASLYFLLRQQAPDNRAQQWRILWAKEMVLKEVLRGRYDDRNGMEAIANDYSYYMTIAP